MESVADILHYGWPAGLKYMVAVMSILMAHEMGHFLQAVRYKVPASLPFFIPMPLPPIGTMGAVIAMPSSRADRRQLFDIGISGPLAGLVLAIPIAWFGIQTARVETIPVDPGGGFVLQDPLLFKAFIRILHPDIKPGHDLMLNPFWLAGWVGMLITGLNMMPISQLDGGHVSYALFGRRPAHALAWLMVAAAIIFIVHSGRYEWMLMLALVVYIGPAHPPTSDDYVPLGWGRRSDRSGVVADPGFLLRADADPHFLTPFATRGRKTKRSPVNCDERTLCYGMASLAQRNAPIVSARGILCSLRYDPNHSPTAGGGAVHGRRWRRRNPVAVSPRHRRRIVIRRGNYRDCNRSRWPVAVVPNRRVRGRRPWSSTRPNPWQRQVPKRRIS